MTRCALALFLHLTSYIVLLWSNPELQAWVAADLASARRPPGGSSAFISPASTRRKSISTNNRCAVLAPVFEAGKVDVVFNGHVHNYQRSFPLRFVPAPANRSAAENKSRHVDGRWMLDKKFNGQTDTTPEGVIYVITGAGGQHLYNPEQQDDPASWQEFTFKHVSKTHSLTVADLVGTTLTIRQLTPAGDEVDRFVITK